MQIYTVYYKENDSNQLENMILVEEGFSWYAAFLHMFWALYNKMWIVSAIILAVEVLFGILESKNIINSDIIDAIRVGFLLLIGASFNDWQRAALEKKGYKFQGVVSGKNEDEARYKFMTGMLHCTTFGSGNTPSGLVY